MNQIERIVRMEEALDAVLAATRALEAAQAAFRAAEGQAAALDAYYGSPEWLRDLADDEAGRLPADLKRGVLSQDGIWNALADRRELAGE